MENVIELAGFSDFIKRTVEELNRGVYEARQTTGIIVDLPTEIQITAVLVDEKQWAKLKDSSTNSTSNQTTQTGSTNTVSDNKEDTTGTRDGTSNQTENGTTTSIGARDEESTMVGNVAHNQQGQVNYVSTGD